MSDEYNEDVQPQENEQEQDAPSNEEQETDEGDGEPDYKALYEKAKQDKNGLLSKVKKMEQAQKSKEPSPQPSGLSEERLDKLELRQLDKELTAEQISDILTIKKAKGLTDASEAYQDPMVQAYLKEVRATTEKKAKTDKATPKTQTKNASVEEKATIKKQSKDWLKEMPGDNTHAMARFLEERYFGDK